MSKFLLYIFITKDRESHLFETHFILLVDLQENLLLVDLHFYYLCISFLYLVHIDDLSYTRHECTITYHTVIISDRRNKNT